MAGGVKIYKSQMKAKVTKVLQKDVDALNIDLMRIVDNKLYRTYKDNLIASYDPRSDIGKEIKAYNEDEFTEHRKKVSYRHTGILARSVDTKIEGNTTRIIIKDDEVYENGKKPSEIIEILKNGSNGGGYYPYTKKTKGNNDSDEWAYNYPTPKHPFEEHTRNEMEVFSTQVADFIKSNFKSNGRGRKRTQFYGASTLRKMLKRKFNEVDERTGRVTDFSRKRH